MIIPKLEDLRAAQFREIHFMKHYPEFYRYIIETYKEEIEQVSAILEEEMKGAANLSVELEVDMHQGNNWYEAK